MEQRSKQKTLSELLCRFSACIMDYIEVSISLQPFSDDAAEWVMAEMGELPFESFSIENEKLLAYIPKEQFSEPNLKVVLSGFNHAGFQLSYELRFIPEENWNAVWEAGFEPVVVDGRCTVKASFHKGLPRTKYTVRIDPKMAFGTGHHQTTTLMIRLLLGMEKELVGKQVMDLGCGTCVLGILAAKMKALSPVHAIDIDPTAVRSALENAKKNRVGDKIKVLCGDASLLQASKYDVLLANINRNILLQDMSTYARSLRPNGQLLVSGFYVEDAMMLEVEAEQHGLRLVQTVELDHWAALKFVKQA